MKLGRDAVAYAVAAFHALGDAAGEARAAGALDALGDAPWSLRELAVGGDELMPLLAAPGRAPPAMGTTRSNHTARYRSSRFSRTVSDR